MPLFYSDAAGGPSKRTMLAGAPHYSYAFPCERIVSLFRERDVSYLSRPEIISSEVARRALGISSLEETAHLIFKPFDQIRVLKGAFNVAHVPWEFNHLVDVPREEYPHPFHSQSRMLRTCDEIWTGSTHAAAVYREHGVEQVHVVPSPVPVPDMLPTNVNKRTLFSRFADLPSISLGISFGINNIPRHQRAIEPLEQQPALADLDRIRLYVTVFNPGDFRKNAERMLRGFATFAESHPEAVLLVKLVIDNERPTLATVQQHTLLPKFRETTILHSKNVIFISSFLKDDAMTDLYRLADHYVCLSIGEGQNLPLCESMAQGSVPISVAHTAMGDYVDESVAFVVPSKRVLIAQPEASHYTLDGHVDAFDCTDEDYLTALFCSIRADASSLAELRVGTHRRARELFSAEAVKQAILQQSGFDFGLYL